MLKVLCIFLIGLTAVSVNAKEDESPGVPDPEERKPSGNIIVNADLETMSQSGNIINEDIDAVRRSGSVPGNIIVNTDLGTMRQSGNIINEDIDAVRRSGSVPDDRGSEPPPFDLDPEKPVKEGPSWGHFGGREIRKEKPKDDGESDPKPIFIQGNIITVEPDWMRKSGSVPAKNPVNWNSATKPAKLVNGGPTGGPFGERGIRKEKPKENDVIVVDLDQLRLSGSLPAKEPGIGSPNGGREIRKENPKDNGELGDPPPIIIDIENGITNTDLIGVKQSDPLPADRSSNDCESSSRGQEEDCDPPPWPDTKSRRGTQALHRKAVEPVDPESGFPLDCNVPDPPPQCARLTGPSSIVIDGSENQMPGDICNVLFPPPECGARLSAHLPVYIQKMQKNMDQNSKIQAEGEAKERK